MLHVPSLTSTNFIFDNFGANPSLTPGTAITPGASNAEGTYTQIATAGNIAQDIYGIFIRVGSGSLNANSKPHLLDIGVDPAGGTSYTAIISNIVCGSAGSFATTGTTGHYFFFPIYIKSGSTVAVRIQGAHATAGTVRVAVRFYGQKAFPQNFPIGYFSETIGTITNSNGVSFTPGNAADGTWVSLGTTVNPLWWWQVAYQIDNTIITAEQTYIELAWGDGSNKHTICKIMHVGATTETIGMGLPTQLVLFEAYKKVPAGATIYIRGRCVDAPDTGYNAVAIGIGG